MSESRIKAVVFDFDGTLYDSKRIAMYLILSDIFTMRTLQAERTSRKSLSGMEFESSEDYYNALFDKMAYLRHSSREKMAKWYNDSYMPRMAKVLASHYAMRPNLESLLKGLRDKGFKTAIFTDYGCTKIRIEAIGVKEQWFDLIEDAPSLGGLKPCQKSFERLAGKLGLKPEEILMVGDRDDTDGEGARRSGMKFYHITKEEGSWEKFLCDMDKLEI